MCSAIMIYSMSSFASVISIAPIDDDLGDLSHGNAYYWRVNINYYLQDAANKGEVLKGAVLSINDINNWKEPEEDFLYITLLDVKKPYYANNPNQLTIYSDGQRDNNQPQTGNYFRTTWNGTANWTATSFVDVYSDYDITKTEDLSWNLNVNTINSFMGDNGSYGSNGFIGIGFDPDCHYWNNGVKLTLITEKLSVSEPGSLSIMLLGLASLASAIFIKRKHNK